MSLNLTTPLPDDWNDAAFDDAHRRLRADPKSLTDSDLVLFLTAHGGTFVEAAQRARETGVPPGHEGQAFLKTHGATPATMKMVEGAVDGVLAVFRNLRVSRRLLAVEARVQALEAMALPHYEGVFEPGRAYPAGSLTTRSGSLWLALTSTSEVPGAGATNWKLVVKSGTVI